MSTCLSLLSLQLAEKAPPPTWATFVSAAAPAAAMHHNHSEMMFMELFKLNIHFTVYLPSIIRDKAGRSIRLCTFLALRQNAGKFGWRHFFVNFFFLLFIRVQKTIKNCAPWGPLMMNNLEGSRKFTVYVLYPLRHSWAISGRA